MDVHASKPLNHNLIWGNFNDYSEKIGETPINRSTAQAYGVGENPLNGKSLPLTGNAEGEEIVYSSHESVRTYFKSLINGDYKKMKRQMFLVQSCKIQSN